MWTRRAFSRSASRGRRLLVAGLPLLIACGDGPTAPRPVAEPALAVGGVFTCRVTGGGTAECWGMNSWGQLGAPTDERCGTEPCVRRPVGVALSLRFRSLSASPASSIWSGHVCGVTTANEGVCWGVDKTQLGRELSDPEICVAQNGLVGQPCSREPVSIPIANLVAVASGDFHTCGLTTEGVVWCWGSDSNGQLGSSTVEQCGLFELPCSFAPVRIESDARFIQVVAGSIHSCALAENGMARCWGNNDEGQLGRDGPREIPAAVAGGLVFARLAAGRRHTCGLTGQGDIYCWGDNRGGQLGGGTATQAFAETRVRSDRRFAAVSAGWWHTCALAGDGTAHCWGSNAFGQLGVDLTRPETCPEAAPCSSVPVLVGGGRRYVAIGAGGAHSCAMTAEETVFCWGDNSVGQLGDGRERSSTIPVRVGG